MLVVNDSSLAQRAEIIREKGTNRSAFFRGEVDKYGWVDVGSSFLPSDIVAAYLFAQLEQIESIQERRLAIWNSYNGALADEANSCGRFRIIEIPPYATNNAHMFYLVCDCLETRTGLIEYLKNHGVHAVFHYHSLHRSPYYTSRHDGRPLPNSDRFADCVVRLPLYFELSDEDVNYIAGLLLQYFRR